MFLHRHRQLLSSILGNILEWYDFAMYGYLAAIIGALFFSSKDSITLLLQAFSVFAIGYLARPLGGIIFGYLGDKYGRSKALRFSLYLMGVSTLLMGALPTYHQIGVAATILLVLLRIFQGISAGGELVGSTVYMFEISKKKNQTFWCSFVTFSCTVGVLLGSLVATLLHHYFTVTQITNGFWRIPYFLGLLLVIFGIWARSILVEPEEFEQVMAKNQQPRFPIFDALQFSYKAMLQVAALNIFIAIAFYGLFLWMPTYLHVFLHYSAEQALFVNTTAMILLVALTPIAGLLADKFGRKWVALLSPLSIALLSFLLFKKMITADFSIILIILCLFSICFSLIEGTTAAITANLFPVRHRLSGIGFAYNLSMSIFGGTTPLICTYLIARAHFLLVPALYITGAAVIGILAMTSIFSFRKGKEALIPEEESNTYPIPD
ncbi:MAG: MFS transporter [Proteobacteria bacterium]|nr:MFS transporter [Pseudomonadota bacterium]